MADDITTSDLREEMAANLPDGYILSHDVVFPDHEIPIKAEVNGKKVVVGSGRIDPATGIFTGSFDKDNEYATVLRGQIEGDVSGASFHPFLNVEALELAQVRQIVGAQIHSISLVSEKPNPRWGVFPIEWGEPLKVSSKRRSEIVAEDPDGPMPKFHDHD